MFQFKLFRLTQIQGRSGTIHTSRDLCTSVVKIPVGELGKALARVQHRMIPAGLTSESLRIR